MNIKNIFKKKNNNRFYNKRSIEKYVKDYDNISYFSFKEIEESDCIAEESYEYSAKLYFSEEFVKKSEKNYKFAKDILKKIILNSTDEKMYIYNNFNMIDEEIIDCISLNKNITDIYISNIPYGLEEKIATLDKKIEIGHVEWISCKKIAEQDKKNIIIKEIAETPTVFLEYGKEIIDYLNNKKIFYNRTFVDLDIKDILYMRNFYTSFDMECYKDKNNINKHLLKEIILTIILNTKKTSFTFAFGFPSDVIDEEVALAITKNKYIKDVSFEGSTPISLETYDILYKSGLNKISADVLCDDYLIKKYLNSEIDSNMLKKISKNNFFTKSLELKKYGEISIKDPKDEFEIKQMAENIENHTYFNNGSIYYVNKIVLDFENKTQLPLYIKYFKEKQLPFNIKYKGPNFFDDKELDLILKCKEYYSNSSHIPKFILDDNTSLEIENVVNAKRIIKDIVNEINNPELKLTSFEKFVYASNIVKLFKEYKEENQYESQETSRSLIYILFNDKIVCVGYAEFLCEIIRQIDDPNLNIIKYSYKYNDEERHARCLVGLIDEKYNINGVFSSDPTFDSVIYQSVEIDKYGHLLMDERKDKDLDIIKESILSWPSEIGNDRNLKLKFYSESGNKIGHRDDSVLIEKFKTILKNGQDYINESTILKAVKEIESKIFMPKYDIQNSNNKKNNTSIKINLRGKSKIVNVSLKKVSGKNEVTNSSFKKH